jgi:hypothetical protein
MKFINEALDADKALIQKIIPRLDDLMNKYTSDEFDDPEDYFHGFCNIFGAYVRYSIKQAEEMGEPIGIQINSLLTAFKEGYLKG